METQENNDYDDYNVDEDGNAYDQYSYDSHMEVEFDLEKQKQDYKPFTICEKSALISRIHKEVEQLAILTAMSFDWNFQLFYQSQFNMSYLQEILDGRHKKLIMYEPFYSLTDSIKKGECEICMCDVQVFGNSCGHFYCFNCWSEYLNVNLSDRNLFEIMPKCQHEDCQQLLHYSLILVILGSDPEMQKKFNTILCSVYCRQNKNVKMCNAEKCEKILCINTFAQRVLVCECNSWLCTYCGKNAHFPIECADMKNWCKIQDSHKNSWLSIIESKPCPFCKEPISKDGGCNHMTCKYPHCKKQFCWICLKKWEGHSDQGCSAENRKWENQRNKMSQNRDKYFQKIQETKALCETFENRTQAVKKLDIPSLKVEILNKFKVMTSDVDFLSEIDDILPKVFSYEKWTAVSKFFQVEGWEIRETQALQLNKMASSIFTFVKQFVVNLLAEFNQMNKSDPQKGKDVGSPANFALKFKEEKSKILDAKTQCISYMRRLIDQ